MKKIYLAVSRKPLWRGSSFLVLAFQINLSVALRGVTRPRFLSSSLASILRILSIPYSTLRTDEAGMCTPYRRHPTFIAK